MKQIVIDKQTRAELRRMFRTDSSFMTRALNFQNDGIRARRIRAYVLNFREYHVVSNKQLIINNLR